jgi:hypothetical protein
MLPNSSFLFDWQLQGYAYLLQVGQMAVHQL